ncbi:MAG: hypothetical protein MRQ13_05415 [Candidatus Midichloria sp.]|nr:hypothetical protein [Candidatus Midichloria sp.]
MRRHKKGIVTAGLLSVIMSTAGSWLNNTSMLVTHDIVKKLIPLTEKQAITIARLYTFGVAGLAVLLSLLKRNNGIRMAIQQFLGSPYYSPSYLLDF